jgi:ribosome-associated protein
MDRVKHAHPRQEPPEAHDDEPRYDGPSKSQVKRDHHVLQDLAKRLLSLPRSELERLELSAATWAAIDETARIKDIRVLGRHYKRIANLLARDDMAAVEVLLRGHDHQRREEAARLHLLERWRERLMVEGDEALGALLAEYPSVDRHQLRTLIRTARKDREQGKPEGERRLFRLLREALA